METWFGRVKLEAFRTKVDCLDDITKAIVVEDLF